MSSSAAVPSCPDVVIIGAGPTGLGAATRLRELGHTRWRMYDSESTPGGLSRSYHDHFGFTWDIGGHVLFSHYSYFDDVADLVVPEWRVLQRRSWVYIADCRVPYPFQNNIHRLPLPLREACYSGLLQAEAARARDPTAATEPQNFEESFIRQFGAGIADCFMRPYNLKVWATPPTRMSASWIGERVAPVCLDCVRHAMEHAEDNDRWGPNATFRYPARGGTGALYERLYRKYLRAHGGLGSEYEVVALQPHAKRLWLANGTEVSYDALISSMPLDRLLRLVADGLGQGEEAEEKNVLEKGGPDANRASHHFIKPQQLRKMADELLFCSTYVVGFGLRGCTPARLRDACWFYFPEAHIPFYRATVLSNYAEHNAPPAHWSLLLEVSAGRPDKPIEVDKLMADCLSGCYASGLLQPTDVVVSRWHHHEPRGYPVPFIGRDVLLEKVLPWLRDCFRIYSRGRFGAWKYEVSNQDHSFMQGVEAASAVMAQAASRCEGEAADALEPTLHRPRSVGMTKEMLRCTLPKVVED